MRVAALLSIGALGTSCGSALAASSTAQNPATTASTSTVASPVQSSSSGVLSGTAPTRSAHSLGQPFANNTSTHPTRSNGKSSGSVDSTAWQACQSSWVAWSNSSSAYMKTATLKWITSTYIDKGGPWTGKATYGTGDVYTTIDGIPHAKGSFTPTSTGVVSGTSAAVTSYDSYSIEPYFTKARPHCSIGFKQCSVAWKSYLSSLGLPTNIANATEPQITPMPTNRPRCSVGDMKVTCNYKDGSISHEDGCTVQGDRVEIFYWPPTTTNATTLRNNSNTAPVTAVYKGTTFTSPSVYLSLHSVYADSSESEVLPCTPVNSPLGATPSITNVPAFPGDPVFAGVKNVMIAVDPDNLSSLIKSPPAGTPVASVVSELAHGGPHFSEYIDGVWGWWNVSTLPWKAANIAQPSAEAYYLVPGAFAPGLLGDFAQPAASTIWDDAYHPVLSVPLELRKLNTAFASCDAGLYGLYDPPIALTPASVQALPTDPGQSTKVPTATSTPKGTAAPSSSPDATALPDHESTSTRYADTTQQGAAPSSSSPSSGPGTQQGAVPGQSNDPSSSDPGTQPESGNSGNGGGQAATTSGSGSDPAGPVGNTDSPAATPTTGSQPAAVITIKSSTYTILSPSNGAPSQQTVNGETVSAGSYGVVIGSSTTVPYSAIAAPTGAVITAGSQTVTATHLGGGTWAVASTTLTAGQVTTMSNGQVVTDQSTALVVGSQTYHPSILQQPQTAITPAPSVAVLTDGSHTYTITAQPGASTAVFGSTTLSVGGPSVILPDGSVLSLAPDGVHISGDATSNVVAFSTPGSTQAVFTIGGTPVTATEVRPGVFVFGQETTLSAGGHAQTIGTDTISAAPSGVVVDGHTVPASVVTAAPAADSTLAVFTLDGSQGITATEVRPGVFVFGTRTLSAGGAAQTIGTDTISAFASGVVVDGHTIPASVVGAAAVADSTVAVFTLDGSQRVTATEVRPGVFVFGRETLSVGGPAETIGSDTISAAMSGVVVDGHTATASMVSTVSSAAASPGTTTDSTAAASTSAHSGAAAGRQTSGAAATLGILAMCVALLVY